MPQTLTPEQTVLAIRALCDGEPVDTSPFHLHPCVCGVPMWQQPCRICGFYPDWGRDNRPHTEACKRSVPDPRTAFITAVERAGNIAVWYVSGWRRSAAWKPAGSWQVLEPKHHAFREGIEALEAKAAEIPCASPHDIYDLVCAEGVKLPRYFYGDVEVLERLRGDEPTLTRYQAGKLRALQDAGLVTNDEYLRLTDEGDQVVSDYNLGFLTPPV
jgi:hypothetical protein